MVEYGNGVGSGPAGQVGGGHAAGAGGDWGGQIVSTAQDAIQQVSALPPGQLLLLIGAVIVGLWVLRRAF
jgi:hypothetical protein